MSSLEHGIVLVRENQVERTGRLLMVTKLVADACVHLTQPAVTHEDSRTNGAFSFLLANPYSNYAGNYPRDYADQTMGYLVNLGHSARTVRKAVRRAHDNDDYRTFWGNPLYGTSSREEKTGQDSPWCRTVSITVERPDVLRKAVELEWGVFDRQFMKAVADVIFEAAVITPDDVEAIQTNIGHWEYDASAVAS